MKRQHPVANQNQAFTIKIENVDDTFNMGEPVNVIEQYVKPLEIICLNKPEKHEKTKRLGVNKGVKRFSNTSNQPSIIHVSSGPTNQSIENALVFY